MNFIYLAKKYFDIDALCEDRTYDGLIWPNENKPPLAVFEAFQREEERLALIDKFREKVVNNQLAEKQHQARQKALEDIRPIEEKHAEICDQIYLETLRLKKDSLDVQTRFSARSMALECWNEIDKTQEIINNDAKKYLADTDWYVMRKQETGENIPEDIVKKRSEARDRIDHGVTVYAKWRSLREAELPPMQKIREALLAGGEELAKMKKLCGEVLSRYPKPKSK